MANRSALVLINGGLAELPFGDSISGGGAFEFNANPLFSATIGSMLAATTPSGDVGQGSATNLNGDESFTYSYGNMLSNSTPTIDIGGMLSNTTPTSTVGSGVSSVSIFTVYGGASANG